MILSIIVAVGQNNEIGFRNALPWRLPADLKRFKKLTTGHTVVMGRKTFESLPNGPLPNRKNIVLSKNPNYTHEQCQNITSFSPSGDKVINPISDSLDCCIFSSLEKALIKLFEEKEVYIIGGSQIFSQALPCVNKLYLTQIHASFPEADAFFPEIDLTQWVMRNEETHHADEKNNYSFTFYDYERKLID